MTSFARRRCRTGWTGAIGSEDRERGEAAASIGARARLIVHRCEAVLMRHRYRLCATVDAELAQDPLDVRGNGLGADEELTRNPLLFEPAREQREHLPLACCQPEAVASVAIRTSEAPHTGDMPANPGDQLVGVERLEHI